MTAVTRSRQYKINVLTKTHDKKQFSCSKLELDEYLKKQAGQDIKRKLAVTYVLTQMNDNTVLGYYSLSSTSIHAGELPDTFTKKFPRYPHLPAILIGRLAVDRNEEGKGIGSHLLIDALKRGLETSTEVGSIAIVVNAKDENASQFYKHFSFIPLSDHSLKLFLPMAEVQKLFQ